MIIEEGLSYESYTRTVAPDARPIIIQPDGDLTINYLDTHGMPLTSEHLASAIALVAKLVGISADEDKQPKMFGVEGAVTVGLQNGGAGLACLCAAGWVFAGWGVLFGQASPLHCFAIKAVPSLGRLLFFWPSRLLPGRVGR